MTDDHFTALCDLADALFLWTLRRPAGENTDTLLALVERLDAVCQALATADLAARAKEAQ